MLHYIRGLGAAMVCTVVLLGAQGLAATDMHTATGHTPVASSAYAEPVLTSTDVNTVDLFPNPVHAGKNITITEHDFYPAEGASDGPIAISVSPTSGPPGTAITVRGTNWTHETGLQADIRRSRCR
jgi:hypothetical protein